MERIKQALEKARQEQGAQPAATINQPSTGEPGQTTASGPIVYSQTRTTKARPEILARHRIIADQSPSPAATAYNMLRTQVLQRIVAKGWNALALTSPGPGQGKTLTAINLAISLAREVNYTVLLVDLDLRNPSIHRYFGLDIKAGISDFLLHGTPLSEILVNPGIDSVVLLPGREPIINSSEMLSSPMMQRLVEELKSRYPTRFVLFDLPPLLSAADALAFAPYVDAALMVIEEGGTTREELENAMTLLGQTQILGTVLNKSSEKITPYY